MTDEELTQQYDDLKSEKYKDGEQLPCYEWRADAPGSEPRCHCHEVPGNLHKGVAPHDETNYKVKPWCAAHQDRCDEGPHPWMSLQEYITQNRIREELLRK